jgi:hypothetical protein
VRGSAILGRRDEMRYLALIVAVTGCLAALTLAGCGSSNSRSSAGAATVSSSTSTIHFAKTKFLLHAGLAFGAFHHFIYEPIKAGVLKHPFLHKLTLIKAGLAALFVYHELKLAAADIRASKILSTLFSPLIAVANKLSALKSALVGGSVSSSAITNLNSQLTSIGSTASSKGQSISQTLPSAAQLASGG